jgi:hypothetical protein
MEPAFEKLPVALKRNIAMLFLLAVALSACNRDWKYLKSTHFNIRARSDIDPKKVTMIDTVLESNYTKVSQFLKTKPDSPIQINIYSHQWQYDLATGNYNDVGSVEGTSDLHFILQAWDERQIGNIAVREFTHAVTLKLLIDQQPKPLDIPVFRKKLSRMPSWIIEGISMYEANEIADPKSATYIKGDTTINLRLLSSKKIHQVAYSLTEYILEKYGHDKLIDLVTSFGDTQKAFGITEEQFTKEWQAYFNKKYL